MNSTIIELKKEATNLLKNNILNYWIRNVVDKEYGGFFGKITGQDIVEPNADKGAILNARILWTFSSAYRLFRVSEYLEMATRAKEYLLRYFYDPEYGGVYWAVDYKGELKDTKKQMYALGFAIYGLSEYARATDDKEAMEYAIKLYDSIEKYSYDFENEGYLEALTRDWLPIADMRLSHKDANEKKTMNTHLHILEPYTNLYRVWKDEGLATRLKDLIAVFLEKIIDKKTNHLGLFFDENWNSKSAVISYGHDIEASWLLYEAALVLNDPDILSEVKAIMPKIVSAASEGLQPDGSLIYEYNPANGEVDKERHWWVQAETVVGLLNQYQYMNDEDALKKADACFQYIKKNLVDVKNGEWYWSILEDGQINKKEDKAGFWKCPYHNGRMCMEIIERF